MRFLLSQLRICLGQVRGDQDGATSDANVLWLYRTIQQFAYNEASFFIIRMLQAFESFSLMQDEAAPLDAIPPSQWKDGKGRKAFERFWPQTTTTSYSKVSRNLALFSLSNDRLIGRDVD